ncbi:MAG: hypothetical protein AB7O96_03295 [Pseudobdellovibrionaceae bacterium]
MNRIECLEYSPKKFLRLFCLTAAPVFVFFVMATLKAIFNISFETAQSFYYIPALLGAGFTYFVFQNGLLEEDKDATEDIDVDPSHLKTRLEKCKHMMHQLIMGLIGLLAVVMFLRPPFYREIGQVVNIIGMAGFFGLGAYFRETLHVYSRVEGVPQKELDKRYAERNSFLIFGWLSLFFFFLKTLGLKGKMGEAWGGLSELPLPNAFLVLAIVIYLVGVFGILFQSSLKRGYELGGYFRGCLALGSGFPIIWLYPHAHPYFFLDLPCWTIQFPLLFLLIINSFGIFLTFYEDLEDKILGNGCLYFIKHGFQILSFVLIWKASVVYVGMPPFAAIAFYGFFFTVGARIMNQLASNMAPILFTAIIAAPFFFTMQDGKLEAKIKERKTQIEQETNPRENFLH